MADGCKCNCSKKKKTSDALNGLFPSLEGKKKASKKATEATEGRGKLKAPKEILKDVFLIPRSDLAIVPRKKKRQMYYKKELVLSAVIFHSNMTETDIRTEIMSRFDTNFPNLSFEFLKAVGDDLVRPTVDTWDYKTVKHVSLQGPLYIRSTKNLNVELEEMEDEDYCYDEEDHEPHRSHASPPTLPAATPHVDNVAVDDQPVPGSSKSDTRSVISCPICYRKFEPHLIEEHADKCAAESKAQNAFCVVVDSESDDNISVVYDGTENNDDISDSADQTEEFNEIFDKIVQSQKNSQYQALRCIRSKAWNNYIEHTKKKWFNDQNNLRVSFLNEKAVGLGTSRDFFQGNF